MIKVVRMAERPGKLWFYRSLFVALAVSVSFTQLLPLNPGPGGLPGPDVMLLIAFAWTVMRPDYVPVLLLAIVFLVLDFLLMRPPGLWTALVVLCTEFLRARHFQLRATSFLVEWLLVAAMIVVLTVVYQVLLAVFVVERPAIGLTLIRMIFTIVTYPLVVILAGRALGLRKLRASEGIGQRL